MNTTVTKTESSSDTEAQPETTQPINYRLQMYRLIVAAAQGQPIDKAELRDAMLELGWENRDYHRVLTKAKSRLETSVEIKRKQERHEKAMRANAELDQIREQCEAAIKIRTQELKAQLQAEVSKLREPLIEFETKNREAIDGRCVVYGERDDRDLKSTLERSAHPHVFHEIADLNNKLLQLDNEARNCRDAVNKECRTVQDIEYSDSGTPLRLRGTTVIDRDYWHHLAAMAKEVMDDETAREAVRDKARRQYYEANGHVETIDSNNKRFYEINSEKTAIEKKIEELSQRLYQWDYFSLD